MRDQAEKQRRYKKIWKRVKGVYDEGFCVSEHGSLWVTLDDNEVHRARERLDEIFGENSAIGQIAWQKRTSRENRAVLSPRALDRAAAGRVGKGGWSARRKMTVVLELLRGAELEATSRKYGVTARTIATARHPNQ